MSAALRCWWRDHEWVEHDGNSFKRRCASCGRVEWLFVNPYPSAGEPSSEWREMPSREARRIAKHMRDRLPTHAPGRKEG